MKLQCESNEVLRSESFQQSEFKIKMGAKAFRVLSKSIYSDYILAIVRELAANAYDAHIAARTSDKPFRIHLPNRFEPFFSIRDYGTGLSYSDIHSLYTTYFESNKNESNEFVGALGLGSKSPFSYTDNFIVTSYYNGVKNVYNMYIDERGFPTVADLSEEPTDEANGLEVNISVEAKDFETFKERTQSSLKWFKVKPEVVGYRNFSFLPDEIYYIDKSEDGWVATGNGESYAIMGNIAYPINAYNCHADNTQSKFIHEFGLRIWFPIGSLDISTSRESLGYDDLTRNAIKEKTDEIIKNATDLIQEKVNSLKNYYAACCYVSESRESIILWVKDKLTYHGKDIVEYFTLPECYMVRKFNSRYGKKKWDSNYVNSIRSYIKNRFVVKDIDKTHESRAKKYILDNKYKEPVLYLLDPAVNDIAIFKEVLGIDDNDLEKISDFPKPSYEKQDKFTGYSYRKSHVRTYSWDRQTFDMSHVKYYVRLKRFETEYSTPYNISIICDTLTRLGVPININELRGISYNKEKKMIAAGGIEFYQFIKKSVQEYTDANPTIFDEIAANKTFEKFGKDKYESLKTFAAELKNLEYNSDILDEILVVGAKDYSSELSSNAFDVLYLCGQLKIPIKELTNDVLFDLENDFKIQYPMLSLFEDYNFEYDKEKLPLIVEYMKSMDKLKELKELNSMEEQSLVTTN